MRPMLVTITVLFPFILFGCSEEPSEKVAAYQDNNEIIGSESEDLIGNYSETIYESIDRGNEEAEEIFIVPVEGTGEQVTPPPGRYTITSGAEPGGYPQAGRILVYDEEEAYLINELHHQGFGVGGVTVNLNGSHTVHVDGMDQAIITPAETRISNELTAGIWEVGVDIEAGKYTVLGPDYGFGYLHIFEEGQTPRVFEFLDISPENPIELDLKAGQKLRISGVPLLEFDRAS